METNVLSPLRKGEIIGGFIYLPMYLIGTQLLLSLLFKLLSMDLTADDTILWLNFGYNLVNLIAILLIFRRFLLGQLRSFSGSVGRIIGTIFLGYAIVYGGNFIINLVTVLLKLSGLDYSNANQNAVADLVLARPLLTLPMVVLAAPIVEETLFRGLIFGLLHRKSRVLAYAVSMILFAGLHVYQPLMLGEVWYNVLISFLTYLPMGFALAWVFARCRSLWGSIALHALNNTVAVIGILIMHQLSGLTDQLPF